MVCEAKRIRSIYLSSPTGRPPGLSTTNPPNAPASFSTINDATTPRRGAFVEQIALRRGIVRQPCANRERLATSFDNLLEIPSGEEIPIVRQQSGGTFLSRAQEAALEELL